jgi:hypothetical protein
LVGPTTPPNLAGDVDVHPILLTQHFLTALLWHVAGNGLKPQDAAVLPPQYADQKIVLGHKPSGARGSSAVPPAPRAQGSRGQGSRGRESRGQ